MRTKSTRMTKKAALAAAILGATLILPGSAVASHNPNNIINHHTCDPDSAEGCPAFEASFAVKVQSPVRNTVSSLQFSYGQPDRRMPVMRAEYYIPAGWRFGGLTTMRPAGAPQCSGIYAANGSLQSAEFLSADTGMLMQFDNERADDPDDFQEAEDAILDPLLGPLENRPVEYGVRQTSGSGDAGNRHPSVAFLNWDADAKEATLCYNHRNNRTAAPQPPPGVPRAFMEPAALERLEGDPLFDWRLSIDLSSVLSNQAVKDQRGSILSHHIGLGDMTGGNWHIHEASGTRMPMPFSMTPSTAGDTLFRAVLSTCAQGLDNTHATGCRNGAFTSQTLEETIRISPSQDAIRHDFGRMTGPATGGLCNNPFCPLGLVLGEDGFTASWNQPPTPGGIDVMGYALTLARPGNEGSRKHFRLITNPAHPEFNSEACGADGDQPSCSLPIAFPLQSTDGSTSLTNHGKYHMALVTIYMKDGRRTDGLCDTGPGDDGSGAPCPEGVSPLRGGARSQGNLLEPGISEWQVLMRRDAWPHVFVQTFDDTDVSTHDPITNRLLLVDWTRKRAEFIIWRTNDTELTFGQASNGIIGDNGAGFGTVVMMSSTTAGATQNWTVSAVVDPLFGQATGVFLNWDVKNPTLTSLDPPCCLSGWPDVGPGPIVDFPPALLMLMSPL